MKVALSCVMVLLVVLLSIPVQALEPFVLYDDFTGQLIEVDKWFGSEHKTGGVVNLENVRVITRGYLRMANVAYSDQNSDSGFNAGGILLNFTDEDLVTAIKASVGVDIVLVTRCPTNSFATEAAVRLVGNFFNTGVPTPGNDIGDVKAYIDIERLSDSTEAPNILHVRGQVVKCTDTQCISANKLFDQDLGTVTLQQLTDLSIQWDQANHRFIFQLNNNPLVYASYTVPDTSPPGLRNKRIGVSPRLPNCTAEPRPMAIMDVYFDKVYVNQSAGP